MREPIGGSPRRTITPVARRTAPKPSPAKPAPRRVPNVRGTSGGISAANRARNSGGPIIDIPATVKYLKDNPSEALKLGMDMQASAMSFGATDVAKAIRERDAVGGALAVAGAVPGLGVGGKAASVAGKVAKVAKVAKTAGKAAKAAKPAAKSGSTVADAIGPAKAAAVREAVGAPKPTPARTPRVPKTKPVEPKTKAAKERYWNQTVPAWNKANPRDKIKIPTSGPTVGKAATDTRRQVATSEANKSAAEAATVKAGRRESAKNSAKKGRPVGDRKLGTAKRVTARQAKAADPNTPKPARTRSKSKPLPTSAKPPVKAVEAMIPDVRKSAAARTKALKDGEGPSRADLGVKGRDKAAAKATDERVANFQQRLADTRAARNRGDLPSYETQEAVGVAVPRGGMRGDLPRTPTKTPTQVKREGVDTERKTRGGMTRIDQGARAADVRSGGKQGKMPASGEKITRTQVAKYKKQYDPQGGNPLDPKTDLSKYPTEVREYMVQARNEASSTNRTSQNVDRLMQPEGRNPGTGARTPTGSKGPDQVPMNATADRNLRAAKPRKGLGKGSRSKDKPGPNAGTGSSRPSARVPGEDPVVARLRAMESRQMEMSKGMPGKAASDGSTKPTSKGTPTDGDRGFYDKPDPRKGDTGSPAQKPPGAAETAKPAAKPKAKPEAKKPAAKPKSTPKPAEPVAEAKPKKPRTSKPKAAAAKPAAKPSKPRTSKPAAATKPKATPKAKPAAKPKATPKKPVDIQKDAADRLNAKPVSLAERRKARAQKAEDRRQASPVAGMAADVLKGRGARRLGSKAAAAAVVGAGGMVAYGAATQKQKQAAAEAAKAKPGPRTPRPADRGPEKAKPKAGGKKVFTEKDGDKYVLDRYGRRISPAEYKRRLAEKKARENAKTPEERLRLYKQQVARREKYRSSEGARKKFGKRATTVRTSPTVKVGDTLRKAANR